MPGQNTLKLNQAQQELLDLFSIEHLPHLYWLINCTLNYKIAENHSLLANLPSLFSGDKSACSNIEVLLPNFKNFPINHRCTANANDSLFVNKFVTCLENFIQTVKKSPQNFSVLSPDQNLAARWLFSGSLIDLCQNFAEMVPSNTQARLDLLILFKNAVLGLANREKIYYKIIYLWKRADSFSQKSSVRERIIEYSSNLVKELSNASLINRIFTAVIFSITCGILFTIAHNPIYHFLHIFRSKESKGYHTAHIVIFPLFPLMSIFGGFMMGLNVGYEGSKYWLFYLTKQHHKSILATSLTIIAAAIAASLVTLLFPPSFPFLMASLPVLANLSPLLVSIAAGIATCIALSIVSATAIFTYTHAIAATPTARVHPTQPEPPALPSATEKKDSIRDAALGDLANYQHVLIPTPQASTTEPPPQYHHTNKPAKSLRG